MNYLRSFMFLSFFTASLLSFECVEPNLKNHTITVNYTFQGVKLSLKVPICPETTLDQIKLKVINEYFRVNNILVNPKKIRDLMGKSILYVYELYEPMHSPNGATRVGSLSNYLDLQYLLHVKS